MSGYAEMAAEQRQREFIEKWTPQVEADEKGWTGDLRWSIARARAAEARVAELEGWLRGFGKALKEAGVRL